MYRFWEAGGINIQAGVILLFRIVFTFRKNEGLCFTSSLMNISQSPYEAEHRVKAIYVIVKSCISTRITLVLLQQGSKK